MTIPLFVTTNATVTRNFSMYWYNTSPHYEPSGGGFSIICFSLKAFYQLFTKVLCTWTQSNDELPLIRYTGARIKLFNSYNTDYIVTYHNCGPMKPNLQTYNSSHPHILQLSHNRKIIPCIKDRPKKRPYTTLRIKPRSEMTNKWYFQNEMNDIPLLIMQASAMSLDRMFASSTSKSFTIGFKTLDTQMFQFHNWKTTSTQGYSPKEGIWLWALANGEQNLRDEPIKNLIFLGDTTTYKKGKPVSDLLTAANNHLGKAFATYIETSGHWGNPFEPTYLTQEVTVLTTNQSPLTLKTKWIGISDPNKTLGEDSSLFSTPVNPFITECRYNPYTDNGNNHIWLENINTREQHNWRQPTDPKLQGSPLPLWISTFGFIDWEKNILKEATDLDYVLIIVSDHINPKRGFYLPIDEDFLHGKTPYHPEPPPIISDQKFWSPKVKMQTNTINLIGSCGPSTIKLSDNQSAEAHCRCTFYFKLGGCAPQTHTIADPKQQPVYPNPNNFYLQPSLQNPAHTPESFLYNWDYRRGQLTKTAIERMLTYSPIKESYASITDSNLLHQTQRQEETSSSEDEEKTQTQTLLQLLQKQRHRQQQLRDRIFHLLTQAT